MIHTDGILDRLSDLAAELKLATLQPQIAVCRQQCNGNHGLDVAVFGRFKAGKSSFLNHLTGQAVLPIGVVPVTAVITRLRFGANERAEVHFVDGKKKDISLDEVRLYVGEDSNPHNEKQVASVEVTLPALRPFDPLEFVDTPGLGSAFSHNTEATHAWLPNVGAALVAISSDAPLSEHDLDLLSELRHHTPKIVLLLTKADLLSDSQRVEVLDFVRKQLRRRFNHEGGPHTPPHDVDWQESTSDAEQRARSDAPGQGLPVFFYSIRPQEGALKAEVEKRLLSPLVQSHDATASQIGRHKLLTLLFQTLNYLRIALAAATQAESSRQALRERLAAERTQLGLFRSELHVRSREPGFMGDALDWYLAQLHSTQQALQEKIVTELRAQFPRWKLRLPPMLGAWRVWLNELLTNELSELSQREKTMFCEPLHETRAHLTRTLRAFHDRLAGHVKAALGVVLTPLEVTLDVREPSAPPVHVAYAFDAAFATIGWLIPLTLFRKPIERRLLRKARYEVEKNLSRLSADWRDRVAKAIDELTGDAEKQVLGELAALEQTLAQTASNVPELRDAVEELEQFEHRLRRDSLSGVTAASAVPTAAGSTR